MIDKQEENIQISEVIAFLLHFRIQNILFPNISSHGNLHCFLESGLQIFLDPLSLT